MKSPKARYQLSQSDVAWHKQVVNSLQYERAADAALLEIAEHSVDFILGARAYQKAFESLSSLPAAPKDGVSTEIDYTKQ